MELLDFDYRKPTRFQRYVARNLELVKRQEEEKLAKFNERTRSVIEQMKKLYGYSTESAHDVLSHVHKSYKENIQG
jgi:hypothetical protein